MECPRCHEPVLATDKFCGKCGYRFDENENENDNEMEQNTRDDIYDDATYEADDVYDDTTTDKQESSALKRERQQERNEKVDAFKKKSQAQWDQIVTSTYMKDLKGLFVNSIKHPQKTKNDAWHVSYSVALTVIGAFILLYSLLLFIPVNNMDGFGLSRLGNTTGTSAFLYILLGHFLFFLLGFLFVFIINRFLSDKPVKMQKLLSDYTLLLIPVFLVLLLAWLMMVVGLATIGLAFYLLGVIILLILPMFVFFDSPHTVLKIDAYLFIVLYVIIAGALILVPLALVLDQLSVFMLSGLF